MPVANCIVAPQCLPGSGDLIGMWAEASGQSSEHMAVNICTASTQCGQTCLVTATLWLPTVWPDAAVGSLQIGLARALARYFGIQLNDVLVMTQMLASGGVVDCGEVREWGTKQGVKS